MSPLQEKLKSVKRRAKRSKGWRQLGERSDVALQDYRVTDRYRCVCDLVLACVYRTRAIVL
jgi:hypothetical protein